MTDGHIPCARPGPAVLLVEDEILIRMAAADYLQDCGYRVFEAGSAAEAVTLLEHSVTQIDLLFTDVRMPGEMNGWGLANWVREHHPAIAIIVTSAESNEVTHELCRELPFLQKPYDFTEVVARIRTLTKGGA